MYVKQSQLYTIILASLLLLFGWGSTSASLQAQNTIPASEQKALLEIYDQCGGTGWADGYNWRAASGPDKYEGVIIEEGHVQAIALDGVGLTGQLPKSFFTAFPELRFVALSNNRLSGPIPEAFGEMTKLQGLSLSSNLWTGQLPNLDKLVNMKILRLANFYNTDAKGNVISEVTGTLPDISKMPQLEYIDASFSNLSGQLPEQIGLCHNLQVLELTANQLTGSIPTSISECTDLQIFSVQDNKMSGEIPDLSTLVNLGKPLDLGLGITEPGRLYLNGNQFTGPFPESVAMLPRLQRFSCANNKLTGALPQDLSMMEDCEAFFADHNQFTGTLPQQLPKKLWYLDLGYNQFTGSIPAVWQDATELGKASLRNNNLSGPVPAIYKKLANLDMIDVRNCRFSFADFKAWGGFIKDKDCIFRFGMQQAYSEPHKESVKSGSDVTFDATYPGTLIGDEHYRWYNLTTMQPVPNANEAKLTLRGVSKEDACRYVCLITSVKMGSTQPRSALRADDGEEQKSDDLQPTLRSGFWDLTVDGYFNGIDTPAPIADDLRVYYDSEAQQLHLASAVSVTSLMIVDFSGVVVARLEPSGATTLALPLATGKYVALLNRADGSCATAPFLVR
ncbi:MAG: hypothetical protein SOW36_05035 [Porphyromonas sp.]|uniref:hypothetical protein n=1 Tax=Porphyromonas sp. TaxID=1924944 RepID=UPI002A753C14|nr:hypothetical protein [Porphyromonas sp.]MDY3111990.1 hypothetical protein [Porphyromonas sp.]